MRAVDLLLAASLVLAGFGSVGANGTISLTVIGARTQVEYGPADVTCLECNGIPANEWLWVHARQVGAFSVTFVDVLYDGGVRDFTATTTADADGRAVVLIPPAEAGERRIEIILSTPETSQSRVFPVVGTMPKDPRHLEIAPVDAMERWTITNSDSGFVFLAIQAPGLSSSSEAPRAVLMDASGRFVDPFATAWFQATPRAPAAQIETSGEHSLNVGAPVALHSAGPGSHGHAQAFLQTGDLDVELTVARSGIGPDEGPRIVLFADTRVLTVTRETMLWTASQATPKNGSANLRVANVHAATGTLAATTTLQHPQSLLVLAASADRSYSIEVESPGARYSAPHTGETILAWSGADCAGTWKVAIDAGIAGADLVTASAEGYSPSPLAAAILGTRACEQG